MKKLILILLTLFLVSCKPSPEVIQKAISQTQTAMPTPTKIPLSSIDLSSVIFKDGDLPAGYEPAQIRSELGDFTRTIPTPDNSISQTLSNNGKIGGLVDILLYEDSTKVQSAFNQITPNMPGTAEYIDVGEQGQVSVNFMIMNTVSLSFTRCNAVVALQFLGTLNKDDAISYATRLDKRLKDLTCK
ncbi:MAG: hypothetical protein C0410_01875 [Anaerolinea sp.]|nr:hypothetical protein [Anaerolinea sp.]